MQGFLFFRKILQIYKLEGADFKSGNSFLELQCKNNQIKHFSKM